MALQNKFSFCPLKLLNNKGALNIFSVVCITLVRVPKPVGFITTSHNFHPGLILYPGVFVMSPWPRTTSPGTHASLCLTLPFPVPTTHGAHAWCPCFVLPQSSCLRESSHKAQGHLKVGEAARHRQAWKRANSGIFIFCFRLSHQHRHRQPPESTTYMQTHTCVVISRDPVSRPRNATGSKPKRET